MPIAKRKRAYSGQMTLDRAAMIRALRAEGASAYDLSRAFGRSIPSIYDVLANRTWKGDPCRGCWRLVPEKFHQNHLCEVCEQQTCRHCGGPKSPGRKSARCVACCREAWDRLVTSRSQCRECGEEMPETRRDVLCSECRADEQAIQTRYRDNRDKRCRQCGAGVPLAKTWTRRLCRTCANEHDRLRRALSRRQCGICGKELDGKYPDRLCSPCRKLDRQIRRRGTAQTAEELNRMVSRRGDRPWDGVADGAGD